MSMFISFNFKTAWTVARRLGEHLRAHGMDAWWLRQRIDRAQLDPVISIAFDNCQRCLILLTTPKLSTWQLAECLTLRQKFANRMPGQVPKECFLFARASDLCPKKPKLPFFDGCQEIVFDSRDFTKLDLSFLSSTPPGLIPLTCGGGRRPRIDRRPAFRARRGQHLLHGHFVQDRETMRPRFCWVLLRDTLGRLYVQQPRPTVTHNQRWAAPNIVIGDGIDAVLLTAVEEPVHLEIVDRVLHQDYGAISDAQFIASLDIIDKLEFTPPG